MYDDQVPLVGQNTFVKNASIEARKGFVQKVYGILCVQLMLTVAIAAPIALQGPEWAEGHAALLWVSIIGQLCTLCVMMCCQSMLKQYPQNYIILFGFTLFVAIGVGFTSAMYTLQSVFFAAVLTMVIFIGLTIYAWNTSTDFTGFGPYLYGALLTLIVMGFSISIMSACGVPVEPAMMLYDGLGVLLFVFFIVFDTQLILGEWGGHEKQFGIDDYVLAALNLYLDLINLFLHILSLLGERR